MDRRMFVGAGAAAAATIALSRKMPAVMPAAAVPVAFLVGDTST
jgi:hypothetical protein